MKFRNRFFEAFIYDFPILVFVLAYVTAGIVHGELFSLAGMIGLLLKCIALFIIVLGLGVILCGGGMDLSIGTQISLTSAVVSVLSVAGCPAVLTVLCALLTGAACGMVNGMVVSICGAPASAATIGTQAVFFGISLSLTRGRMVSKIPDAIRNISRTRVLGIRQDVWIFLIFLGLEILLFHFSAMGKYIRAAGLNRETAKRCGVPVYKAQCFSYVFGGICYSCAALILISGRGYAGSELGKQMEIVALIAAYCGGILNFAKRPRISLLLLGALSTGILTSGYLDIRQEGYLRYMLLGMVMLLSIVANRRADRIE